MTVPGHVRAAVTVLLGVGVLQHDAAAQTRIFGHQELSRAAAELAANAAQGQQSRDSLVNGTVVGAAIGAGALGTFAAILCNALQEPDDPSCLPDVLRIAGIGAAIGAGAGLAIDAALSTHPGVVVRVGLRF